MVVALQSMLVGRNPAGSFQAGYILPVPANTSIPVLEAFIVKPGAFQVTIPLTPAS